MRKREHVCWVCFVIKAIPKPWASGCRWYPLSTTGASFWFYIQVSKYTSRPHATNLAAYGMHKFNGFYSIIINTKWRWTSAWKRILLVGTWNFGTVIVDIKMRPPIPIQNFVTITRINNGSFPWKYSWIDADDIPSAATHGSMLRDGIFFFFWLIALVWPVAHLQGMVHIYYQTHFPMK